MIVVTWEGNPTVIMLMSTAKSLAKLRGEILAGKLQLQQNCIWITFIDFQPKQIISKRENEKSKEEFHVSWSVFGGRISLLLMSDVSPLRTPSPLCYLCYYCSLSLTSCWSKQPISSLSPMGAAGSTASIKRISRACPSGIWREEEEREPNGWTRNRVASRSQARLSPRSPPIYSSCPYNPLPIFQNNSWQAPVTCDHRGSKLCRQYWSCIVISSALTVFQFQVLHAPAFYDCKL